MLKLYGFPASNYVNMVNLALLAKSPRGKVPFLETPQGFIAAIRARYGSGN